MHNLHGVHDHNSLHFIANAPKTLFFQHSQSYVQTPGILLQNTCSWLKNHFLKIRTNNIALIFLRKFVVIMKKIWKYFNSSEAFPWNDETDSKNFNFFCQLS